MVVRTQSHGRGATGLYIGARNARRYFKKHTHGIDLQLGHIQIHCALTPEFWRGQPEIIDSRLSSWLESKVFHQRSCRTPIPMLMIPSEKNCFKLQPIKLPAASAVRTVSVSVAMPARKIETKVKSVPASLAVPLYSI
jgi:hypothetical protein